MPVGGGTAPILRVIAWLYVGYCLCCCAGTAASLGCCAAYGAALWTAPAESQHRAESTWRNKGTMSGFIPINSSRALAISTGVQRQETLNP